jgi:XTP/dITP diphosphohydrolase
VTTRLRIWVATSNRGKVAEIRAIMDQVAWPGGPVEWAPASEWRSEVDGSRIVYPDEGDDYRANAVAKAATVARQTGGLAVADDSGLEVDALDGAPGPHSARYGGPDLDDGGRVAHLLDALEAVPDGRRGARFVCWAAWAGPVGEGVGFGECRGALLAAPRGLGGFGYDPIFVPEGFDVTMAELPSAEKNRISHRARAFRALAGDLAAALAGSPP